MCHAHTTHFACTHAHAHLELCPAAIEPLIAAAVTPTRECRRQATSPLSSLNKQGQQQQQQQQPLRAGSWPLATGTPSPTSTPGSATSSTTSSSPSQWWSAGSRASTPASSSSSSSPTTPPDSRGYRRGRHIDNAHKTTHTSAPSASVCVNCTGPPLEYPYPYPQTYPLGPSSARRHHHHHHHNPPHLDIFDLDASVRAWDAHHDAHTHVQHRPDHLAASLTVSVARPLSHDPYADGEAAPDVPGARRAAAQVQSQPQSQKQRPAPAPMPVPAPVPVPMPTCPKAPRLRPVSDGDGERCAGARQGKRESGGAQGGARGAGAGAGAEAVNAVEIEKLSLDGDGDGGVGEAEGGEDARGGAIIVGGVVADVQTQTAELAPARQQQQPPRARDDDDGSDERRLRGRKRGRDGLDAGGVLGSTLRRGRGGDDASIAAAGGRDHDGRRGRNEAAKAKL